MNTTEEIAQLRERIEDAEGESAACSDNDCGCHRVPPQLEEEIEWLLEQ